MTDRQWLKIFSPLNVLIATLGFISIFAIQATRNTLKANPVKKDKIIQVK